jgi:hypothetical protein
VIGAKSAAAIASRSRPRGSRSARDRHQRDRAARDRRGWEWSFTLGDFSRARVYETLSLLAGFAFGLMLMSSAPAIGFAYLLPTASPIVSEVVPGFRHTADWLDTAEHDGRLRRRKWTSELWQQLLTSELLWIVLRWRSGSVRLGAASSPRTPGRPRAARRLEAHELVSCRRRTAAGATCAAAEATDSSRPGVDLAPV